MPGRRRRPHRRRARRRAAPQRSPSVHPDFARPPLADGVVRFVGEAIALVVAETVAAAADGAAAVWADYEPLTAITDPEAAFDDEAPVIFPAHGSNQAMVVTDADPVDLEAGATWSCAAATSTSAWPSCRWSRTAARRCPATTAGLTFYASTQMPHMLQGQLAAALGMQRCRAAGHRPAGRRRLRRQGRVVRRVLGHRRRGPPPRPARHVDADRAATTSSRSLTAAARSSTPSSAAAATARSPACACASSATAARTRASAPSYRPAPSGWPTARTASPPSSSTSPSP